MTTLLGARRASVGPPEKAQSVDRQHPEDAGLFPQITPPPPIPSKADAVWRVGKFIFRADFDSANLDYVEQGMGSNEFLLQTQRDCGGTANEKATRTWFYFSIGGHTTGELVALTILNLNKQSRLYSQDYRPVFWSVSQPEWQPMRLRVTYRREGDDFQLRFCHRFENEEETFFAFAIPFSYHQTQELLDRLDEFFPFDTYGDTAPSSSLPARCASSDSDPGPPHPDAGTVGPVSAPVTPRGSSLGANPFADRTSATRPGPSRACSSNDPCGSSGTCQTGSGAGPGSGGAEGSPRIYYRRQLLTRSLERRRVEVITITDCSGAASGVEPPLPGLFAHDPGPPAATFRNKTVFFVSSRVHPGETPATHMFNGMLAFLLRRTDPRAVALRRRFVFKLVPLVNPDGVTVGNYRTDTLGQNLNRYYNGVPDEATQPSVYAIKTLLMHYANAGLLEYYIDLHAHANKKGVFIYGNTLDDGEAHLQSLMYARLVALNNASFDFIGCNYTEKNMSRPDKDGASKEGAGRVALYRETGLTHLYTVEANYNTARTLNVVAPASGDHGGRASPPCKKRFPPKFTVGAFHAVGRAFLVAALDMEASNPWSRLPLSEHHSLEGVRSWLLSMLRASPDTRAAQLPPMSDAIVEVLRGMIASGALRMPAALASCGRARQRSSMGLAHDASNSALLGHGTASSTVVAFGRTISGTHIGSARRPAPPPSPGRRLPAGLPSIGTAAHGPGTPVSPSVASRRNLGRASLGSGAPADGRSASVPIRTSTNPSTPQTSSARLLSPRQPQQQQQAATHLGEEPGSGSASASELGHEEDDPAGGGEAGGVGPAASEPARRSAEGPSDSDGDDDMEEPVALVPGGPPPALPVPLSTPMQAPPRFRPLEPAVRISPAHSFKGAAVYCGKVTEFKFPVSDRGGGGGGFDGGLAALMGPDGALRGSLAIPVASVVRSRPSSAGPTRRPLSAGVSPGAGAGVGAGAGLPSSPAGGSASAAAATVSGPVPAAAAPTPRHAVTRSVAHGSTGSLSSGGAVPAHHMMLPRTLGNGAAVLMTSEQLSGGGAAAPPATSARSRSTLSFARSSSANRRNR